MTQIVEYIPLIVALVAVGFATPLAFKLFFSGSEEFRECLRYGIKPNFLSWLDNDLQRDYAKTFKLNLFGGVLIFIGVLVYSLVDGVLFDP